MLSSYCKEIANKYNILVVGVKMLVPGLGIKGKYVLQNRNLQLGMKLKKIIKH